MHTAIQTEGTNKLRKVGLRLLGYTQYGTMQCKSCFKCYVWHYLFGSPTSWRLQSWSCLQRPVLLIRIPSVFDEHLGQKHSPGGCRREDVLSLRRSATIPPFSCYHFTAFVLSFDDHCHAIIRPLSCYCFGLVTCNVMCTILALYEPLVRNTAQCDIMPQRFERASHDGARY